MIHFVVRSSNQKLKEAGLLAPMFFKQLSYADLPLSFTHTELNVGQVYAEIVQGTVYLPDRYVVVETYRPKWPWSKAIGYTLPKKPNYIFVNQYMLERLEVADYVGNFVHETMHLIGFKHRTNNPKKYRNLESVPYAVGSLAEAWARYLSSPAPQLDLPIEPAILPYD
jgi:hypothetical protein